MRTIFLIILLVFPAVGGLAQDYRFQTGHTNDILKVKFSPDDSKLVSYSWGDGWLCYWDLKAHQLVWKSKTGFIERAYEHPNLEDFGWNKDMSLLYSRSENGTFQTWDAKTGRILSISEISPDDQAFIKRGKKFSVTTDYSNFNLTNSETKEAWTIKAFSRTNSVYDVSNDERLFAEGGSWGHAVIRITEIRNPANTYELKGGRIPPYLQTELETKRSKNKLSVERSWIN